MNPDSEVAEEELAVYRAALNAALDTDDYGVELGWAGQE